MARILGLTSGAYNLPDHSSPPNCDNGGIWTNLTTEEAQSLEFQFV